MKLLFVWIEKYRNIRCQGFTVDDEFSIVVSSPYKPEAERVDSCGSSTHRMVNIASIASLVNPYRRKISIYKNENYASAKKHSFLDSICALVGENAVGKSNILSCFTQRHERGVLPDDVVSAFWAFLDTTHNRILLKAQGMYLYGDGIQQVSNNEPKYRDDYNVYEYILDEKVLAKKESDITHLISIGSGERFEGGYTYMNFDIPCTLLNLSSYKLSKKLKKAFEYLCNSSIKEGKKLVFSIKSADDKYPERYFIASDYTADERKQYFVKKLLQLVFHSLRDFLFQERNSSKELFDEYMKCGEIISFTNCSYPDWDSNSLIREHSTRNLIKDIDIAIDFFSKCTYMYNLRPWFLDFLQQLKVLANLILSLSAECFTAFYKLELDFDISYTKLIDAWQQVMKIESWQPDWVKGLHVEIEWLSAGEEQQVAMFASLYQTLSGDKFDGFDRRHILLLLDEPEMHMHPQTSSEFTQRLLSVLSYFNDNGYFKSCQIIMSTHSPFIVRDILNLNYHLHLVRKSYGYAQIEDLSSVDLSLYHEGKPSLNLVLHYVFDMYTVELFDELYGYIEENVGNPTSFADSHKINHRKKTRLKVYTKGKKKGQTEIETVCIAEYVRQSIHHPENKLNPIYTPEELKESIDWMLPLAYAIKRGEYMNDC